MSCIVCNGLYYMILLLQSSKRSVHNLNVNQTRTHLFDSDPVFVAATPIP